MIFFSSSAHLYPTNALSECNVTRSQMAEEQSDSLRILPPGAKNRDTKVGEKM